MEKFITLKDNLRMPTIGMTCSTMSLFFLGLMQEAMDHGLRYFEVPFKKTVFPQMWDVITRGHYNICHPRTSDESDNGTEQSKNQNFDDMFFISTTMHISTRLGPMIDKTLTPFLEKLCLKSVHLLFLENPFTRDANIRKYYEVDPDDSRVGFEPIEELFERNPENGMLKVEPIIQQNLWLMWKRMEKMVMCENPKVRHLGLRNFSQGQIEGILKVAKIPPSVVQVEINLYNMQTALRKMCRERNIHVVAVNPFGNKNQDISWKPSLTKDPLVVEMARDMGVAAQTLLMRHLLQSGIPVMFDVALNCNARTLKRVWEFQLSEKQMARLATLDKSGSDQYKTELDFRCEIDPLWPFRIPPRKKSKRRRPNAPRPSTRPRLKEAGSEQANVNSLESHLEENREVMFRLAREPLSYLVGGIFMSDFSEIRTHLVKSMLSSASTTTLMETCLEMTDWTDVTDELDYVDFRNIGGDFGAKSKDSFSEAFSRAVHTMLANMSGRDGSGDQRRLYVQCPQELQVHRNILGLDQTHPYVGVFHMDLTE